CFYVRERRAAQGQPFGLEDARPRLVQSRGRDILQHVGLRRNQRMKTEREAGFPPPPPSLPDSAGSSGPGGLTMIHRLFGRSLRHRENRYECAAVGFGFEFDMAFDLGKESMVGAHADIEAGVPGRAALTRNDVAGNHMLATKSFDAKA